MKKYDNFINEKISSSTIFLLLTMFNSIGMDKPIHNKYDRFYNDIQNIIVPNTNVTISKVLDDVKNKVSKDNRIKNKQELIDKLNSVVFIVNKNNKSKILFDEIKRRNNNRDNLGFTFYIKNKPFIGLNKFDNKIIRHELFHIVDDFMIKSNNNINKDIIKMFDFNMNYNEYSKNFEKIVNYEYRMKLSINKELIKKYLLTPSEIFVRLNTLKFWLLNNGYIKDIGQKIPNDVMIKLLNGEIFKNIKTHQEKLDFMNSDFMEIIIFIKNDKIKDINDFVYNSNYKKINMI